MKKKYMIPRKQYKEIKKYDHSQMEEFCETIYATGYENGKNDAITRFAEEKIERYQNNSEYVEDISEQLKKLKGIGEIKHKIIMSIVSKVLGVDANG